MYPEYLCNNDTEQIYERVRELAETDEPALRAECQEVSHQADTSSLAVKNDCLAKANNMGASLGKMTDVIKMLSRSLTSGAEIFNTREGQADFGTVCRAVIDIEEERRRLLSCITELTQARQILFASVADANRALHFLKTAKGIVPEDLRIHYAKFIECTEVAYARLLALDENVRQVQTFYMTFLERHFPVFMEKLRAAADFNHAGAALDRGAIRTLCTEALIAISRAPNIAF